MSLDRCVDALPPGRPARAPRPRVEPDRADHRGDRRRGRGGGAVPRGHRPPQPPVPAEVVGFRDVAHAADAARRDARHRPGHLGDRDRRAAARCRWGRSCSGGWWTRSARPMDDIEGQPLRVASDAVHHGGAAGRAVAAADRGARVAGRARARRAGAVRPRPAARHLRRLGRGQVVADGHDRPLDRGRRERDLPGRRARPRGARVHRPQPRARRASAASWWSPPPTSRRCCASRPRSRPRRSPSGSATRAGT